MSLTRLIFISSLLLTFTSSRGQTWKVYPYSPDNSLITFPKDEGAHPNEPIEWWYTVGHLTGQTTGIHYSFMLTYFHYPQFGFDGFRIFNLTNDDTGTFYGESRPCLYPTLSPDSLHIVASVYNRGTETWRNKRDGSGRAIPFEYNIFAASSHGSLQVDFAAQKPPLILADSGFFYQGLSGYTYYYSQTDIRVSGVINLAGITENVTGSAWTDRQYGSFNPAIGEKYEWFNLQLSNGIDLNVFNVFTADNRTPNSINYKTLAVYVDSASQYTTSDFQLDRLAFEYTNDSVQCYSKKWRLTSALNQIDVTFEAPYSGYEVLLPFRFYEGPTTVTGTVQGKPVVGKGFAELLHSYEKPKVEFKISPTLPPSLLRWQLLNPDEANTIYYDLSYRTENQANYLALANGMIDTAYTWASMPMEKLWIKLTSYSRDTTLISHTYLEVNPLINEINESDIHAAFSIYPNPMKGVFAIELPMSYSKFELSIMDQQGKAYQPSITSKENGIQVDVSNLRSGLYFTQVKMDGEVRSFKLIVE